MTLPGNTLKGQMMPDWGQRWINVTDFNFNDAQMLSSLPPEWGNGFPLLMNILIENVPGLYGENLLVSLPFAECRQDVFCTALLSSPPAANKPLWFVLPVTMPDAVSLWQVRITGDCPLGLTRWIRQVPSQRSGVPDWGCRTCGSCSSPAPTSQAACQPPGHLSCPACGSWTSNFAS